MSSNEDETSPSADGTPTGGGAEARLEETAETLRHRLGELTAEVRSLRGEEAAWRRLIESLP